MMPPPNGVMGMQKNQMMIGQQNNQRIDQRNSLATKGLRKHNFMNEDLMMYGPNDNRGEIVLKMFMDN